jgi:hypothetical protein
MEIAAGDDEVAPVIIGQQSIIHATGICLINPDSIDGR